MSLSEERPYQSKADCRITGDTLAGMYCEEHKLYIDCPASDLVELDALRAERDALQRRVAQARDEAARDSAGRVCSYCKRVVAILDAVAAPPAERPGADQ